MRKQEVARKIAAILDTLYGEIPIPLQHSDGYTLLIATLLSAQCTDLRVNSVTPLLFAKASTPEAMITLSVEEIQAIIRPCGLSKKKAEAIFELSRLLLEKFQGKVPSEEKELESLPGVGHKTASVVLSQWFGKAAFPIDTHIHRLAKRWGLTRGKRVEETEKDLKKLFPKKSWNRLHLQMIYFGREYCKARGHIPSSCPICSWILAPKL